MSWFLILSIVTAGPLPAASSALVPGFIDGGRLYALCSARANDVGSAGALCLGYVIGSVDQVLARQARRPVAQHRICLPAGQSAEQLSGAISERIGRDRRLWSQAASTVVQGALEDLYPCRPDERRNGR